MLKHILVGFTLSMILFLGTCVAGTKDTLPAILWEKNLEDAIANAKAAYVGELSNSHGRT